MNDMTKVKVFRSHPMAKLPSYMTDGAAGADVYACLETAMKIAPGSRAAISTGLRFEIPEGFEVQVRPRSGLAFKQGLTVVNAPGTIDSDYRGEVKILVINLGDKEVEVQPGDRIAQFILQRVERIDWEEVDGVEASARNEGGFGSTGVNA